MNKKEFFCFLVVFFEKKCYNISEKYTNINFKKEGLLCQNMMYHVLKM